MDPRHWAEVRAWSKDFGLRLETGGGAIGTIDFKALVASAAAILPSVHIYCKPITARPPVVLPIYSDQFWTKWFPRARSGDLARFLALARRGRPYDKPDLAADLPEVRERYMEGLKIQQLEHMRVSLDYCRNTLNLGFAGADESVAGLAGSTQLDFPVPVILP